MENLICVEKQIVLSGDKEIFRYIVDFEDELHENHCIQFLEHTAEQMPKLRLKLLKKESGCLCSENLLKKVKDILNNMHESKLIDIFEYIEEKCIIGQQPQNKFIVCHLVSHLKDICTEKRFTELERTLLVKDIPGYKEIFQCFVDFENELHKKNCIIFLPLNGAKEQMLKMPKLRLKLFGKKDKCSCSENFLDKVKDISNDLPESMLIHIFKVYLQEYVSNEDTIDKNITCRLVSHLQDICISKGLPELAKLCFQTNMTDEKLMKILTERFDTLSDKITAVIISEMDSEM